MTQKSNAVPQSTVKPKVWQSKLAVTEPGSSESRSLESVEFRALQVQPAHIDGTSNSLPYDTRGIEPASSYKVCSEGALTYFDYYFDDKSVADSAVTVFKVAPIYRSVIGVGVLATTVVSGLAIAEALQKPTEPNAGDRPLDANQKPSAPTTAANPNPAQPERLPVSPAKPQRSATQSAPQPSSSKPILRSPNQTVLAEQVASLPSPAEIARINAALMASNPSPTSPARAANYDVVPLNAPPTIRSLSPVRTANLPSMSAPETLAAGSTPSAGLQQILAKAAPNTPPNSTESANADSTPTATPATDATTNLVNPQPVDGSGASENRSLNDPMAASIAPTTPSLPTSGQPAIATPESRPFPPDGLPLARAGVPGIGTVPSTGGTSNSASAANAVALPESFTPTPSVAPMANGVKSLESPTEQITPQPTGTTLAAGLPQGIRDYLVLGQKPTDVRRVSLMSLSQQAATEAVQAKQIEQFTVRHVSPQEYQKEWLASNPSSPDPEIASAYPAYGFIDYQRQVIVVLQDQPQAIALPQAN
jgi:hypothetical protein